MEPYKIIVRSDEEVNTVRTRLPPYVSVATIPDRIRGKFKYFLDTISADEADTLNRDQLHTIEIDYSNMQRWYPAIENYTAKTDFIHLTPSEIKIIRNMQTLCMARGFDTRDYLELNDLLDRLRPYFESTPIKHRFFKLSSVSPKDIRDAPCYDEMVQYCRSQCTSKGQYRKLCVHSPEECIWLLLNSERLYATMKDRPFGHYLVFREWVDANPEFEFRCFIYDGQLTAISQYHSLTDFRFTAEQAVEYGNMIRDFWNLSGIRDKLLNGTGVNDWVMDVVITDNSILRVVELNGFGAHMITGSAQYCWKLDYDLIHRIDGGCTVRHLLERIDGDVIVYKIMEQEL